ncbi:hypothetical protein GJ496_007047 [Pomphorhynchus laevis]|nr:hypothetical protein GJ496_007047 [Pomphorhynchus laevis]
MIRKTLKRRLSLWCQSRFSELFYEAHFLQKSLNCGKQRFEFPDRKKQYISLLNHGKCSARSLLLLEDTASRILSHDAMIANKTVREYLRDLHRTGVPGHHDALLKYHLSKTDLHRSIRFTSIDEDLLIFDLLIY